MKSSRIAEGHSIRIYVAIFLISSGSVASAIKCFKCTMKAQNTKEESVRLCAEFDYTNRFIVNCPNSTMCMKKTFTWTLVGEPIIGVERDCAQQANNYLEYENGKWNPKVDIKEPYVEGCKDEADFGERSLRPNYCFCRSNLCNSAPSKDQGELSYHVDAMAVIFVFNALKYFRSMEIG